MYLNTMMPLKNTEQTKNHLEGIFLCQRVRKMCSQTGARTRDPSLAGLSPLW